MLERAGEELPRQVDRQQLRIRVDVLVAGHGHPEGEDSAGLDDDSLNPAILFTVPARRLFLQPR
jgi:hypothetical protein